MTAAAARRTAPAIQPRLSIVNSFGQPARPV
jgi:hypothetical protein